jgi:hypothetical protein
MHRRTDSTGFQFFPIFVTIFPLLDPEQATGCRSAFTLEAIDDTMSMNIMSKRVRVALLLSAAVLFSNVAFAQRVFNDPTQRTSPSQLVDFVDARTFGAVGDNSHDDTWALQTAATTVASQPRGGTLYLPPGVYKINSAITVPVDGMVTFVGAGSGSTIIRQTGRSADGIVFTRNDFGHDGGGIKALTIEAGSGLATSHDFGSGSNGIGVSCTQCTDNFITEDVSINGFATGMALFGSWNTRHYSVRVLMTSGDALLIDKNGASVGASNLFNGLHISNSGFTGDNTRSNGIRIRSSGGEYFSQVDTGAMNTGVRIDPRAGDYVLYLFGTQVLADTCAGDGWVFDGANGSIWSHEFVNSWAAYNGGNGITVTGKNIRSVEFSGRVRENAQHGINLQAGGFHFKGGQITSNSRRNHGTFDGVFVAENVSEWSIVNAIIGNDGTSLFSDQRNGITIAPGVSDNFVITGDRFESNGNLPFVDGSRHVTSIIQNNYPLATLGINQTGAMVLSGVSSGPVEGGQTVYLGDGPSHALANYVAWYASRSGVISTLQVFVDAAPGADQSFTYTVRKNGIDTALVGNITGDTSTSLATSSPAVAVAAGDRLSIRLVTTARAAATNHRVNLRIE